MDLKTNFLCINNTIYEQIVYWKCGLILFGLSFKEQEYPECSICRSTSTQLQHKYTQLENWHVLQSTSAGLGRDPQLPDIPVQLLLFYGLLIGGSRTRTCVSPREHNSEDVGWILSQN